MVKVFFLMAISLTFLSIGGCGTIVDMTNDQKIYGGTRFDGKCLSEDMNLGPCASLGPLWIIDLPCSLAADTILLPVTIILAITRASSPSARAEEN